MQYLHEVRVSLQAAARLAERALLASQLPDQESLVSRGADDHSVVVKRRAAKSIKLLKAQNSSINHFVAQTVPRWQ